MGGGRRVVQHYGECPADRCLHSRPPLYLKWWGRHIVRCEWKEAHGACHCPVDLRCLSPDRLATNAPLGRHERSHRSQTPKGSTGADSTRADEGTHKLCLPGLQTEGWLGTILKPRGIALHVRL